jgi:hypothetical protein
MWPLDGGAADTLAVVDLWHLARRFAGSLWPFGPPADGRAWAARSLLPGELALWQRMSPADRRHSLAVARRVDQSWPHAGATPQPVIAAAMLHDVGKIEAGLGTFRRVFATIAGAATGGRRASAWAAERGPMRRVGLYLRHAPIGADLLAGAGSDALAVTWAREHHLPASGWTIDAEMARVLKDADDD